VRGIGWLIAMTERSARFCLVRTGNHPRAERFAGVALAVTVVGLTSLAVWGAVAIGDRLGGILALLFRSLLIYWGLAARSLGDEALRASGTTDLVAARRELAMIVGRDTAELGRSEIDRACVETVAENTSDGIVAPLFWLALLGPVGLWAYKAISTLDSMVGYRNERYLRLGWASARLDDLACLVPARLTWLLIALASILVCERPWAALRIGWRDGRKHPSPNAAWGEAAMAGALGVQLGGVASYGGVVSNKPRLGDSIQPIEPTTVRRAVRLMQATAVLAIALAWAVRLGLTSAA
jgi:adenosylcobinamide-phosphate synthase